MKNLGIKLLPFLPFFFLAGAIAVAVYHIIFYW